MCPSTYVQIKDCLLLLKDIYIMINLGREFANLNSTMHHVDKLSSSTSRCVAVAKCDSLSLGLA